MSTFQTSQSLTKRKRGLSLSLQKKTKRKIENQQTASVFKDISMRQSLENVNGSARKNKIKFAQSYQKHQSGSKFKRQNYFKTTDQDIKLGGNKKITGHQKKILPLANTSYFSHYAPNIEVNPKPTFNLPVFSQRKVLRESKVVSLTSNNINYFQGRGLQQENSLSFWQFDKQRTHHNFFTQTNTPQPFANLEPVQEVKLEEFKRKQFLVEKIQEESSESTKKQSMDKFTLQKLKKVQIDIDQLLAKASETRTIILR